MEASVSSAMADSPQAPAAGPSDGYRWRKYGRKKIGGMGEGLGDFLPPHN